MTTLRIALTLVVGLVAELATHRWVLALIAAAVICWLMRPRVGEGRAYVVTDLTDNTTRVIETRSKNGRVKL